MQKGTPAFLDLETRACDAWERCAHVRPRCVPCRAAERQKCKNSSRRPHCRADYLDDAAMLDAKPLVGSVLESCQLGGHKEELGRALNTVAGGYEAASARHWLSQYKVVWLQE